MLQIVAPLGPLIIVGSFLVRSVWLTGSGDRLQVISRVADQRQALLVTLRRQPLAHAHGGGFCLLSPP